MPIDESWQGCGLLADLAYASLARLRACHAYGVRCVIRLKDNWKPKVDYLARGQVTREFCPGTDLDVLLEKEILVLNGHTVDADVRVGSTNQPLHLRLVGVHTPKGYGFFLTNLPPRLGPRQIADLYRVRWEVELSITLDTSVHRLDQVDAERACSVKTLLHASRIASIIAILLAHIHTMQTRPSQEGEPRTEAPLHPRRLALQLAVSWSVDCPRLRPQGDDGEAVLATNRSIAYPFGKRPQLASSTLGLGSTPRLETSTCGATPNQPPSSKGSGLSGHI